MDSEAIRESPQWIVNTFVGRTSERGHMILSFQFLLWLAS